MPQPDTGCQMTKPDHFSLHLYCFVMTLMKVVELLWLSCLLKVYSCFTSHTAELSVVINCRFWIILGVWAAETQIFQVTIMNYVRLGRSSACFIHHSNFYSKFLKDSCKSPNNCSHFLEKSFISETDKWINHHWFENPLYCGRASNQISSCGSSLIILII